MEKSSKKRVDCSYEKILIYAILISLALIPLTNTLQTYAQEYKIPSWIKNNAKWWSEGQVSDEEFVKGMQYMMQNGIMYVPSSSSNLQYSSTLQIPTWIKKNAGWWASGQISDDDFVKGIQYLIGNGMINVNPASGDIIGTNGGLLAPSPPTSYVDINQASSTAGCRTGGLANVDRPEWASVNDNFPVEAMGTVDEAALGNVDWPFTHNSHDVNFKMVTDDSYNFIVSNGNEFSPTDPTKRMLEVEWESNDIPEEFWPSPGDRVIVMGDWIVDCGHPPGHTEIHPSFADVFIRNGTIIPKVSPSPTQGSKTYFFVHNRGGYLEPNRPDIADSAFNLAMQVQRNYTFDIPMPPRPAGGILVTDVEDKPFGGPDPIIIPEPNSTNPTFLNVTIPLDPGNNATYLFDWNNPNIESIKSYLVSYVSSLEKSPYSTSNISQVSSLGVNELDFSLSNVPTGIIPPGGTTPTTVSGLASFKLDSGVTNARLDIHLYGLSKNDHDVIYRHSLIPRMNSGILQIYDYDQQHEFKYGIVIAAGWHEPVLDSGYHLLDVSIDGAKVPTNPRFCNSYTGHFHEWINMQGQWGQILDHVNTIQGDTKESVEHPLRETDYYPTNVNQMMYVADGQQLTLYTSGWEDGPTDNDMGVNYGWDDGDVLGIGVHYNPTDFTPGGDHVSGTDSISNIEDIKGIRNQFASCNIGSIFKNYTKSDNFGIGQHEEWSHVDDTTGIVYTITDMGYLPAGTPTNTTMTIKLDSLQVFDNYTSTTELPIYRTGLFHFTVSDVEKGPGEPEYNTNVITRDFPLNGSFAQFTLYQSPMTRIANETVNLPSDLYTFTEYPTTGMLYLSVSQEGLGYTNPHASPLNPQVGSNTFNYYKEKQPSIIFVAANTGNSGNTIGSSPSTILPCYEQPPPFLGGISIGPSDVGKTLNKISTSQCGLAFEITYEVSQPIYPHYSFAGQTLDRLRNYK